MGREECANVRFTLREGCCMMVKEKTRTEIDRRGYSLDYINTPNDDLKFTLNLNGAEFDRDVYQHGKQDLFVFPQVMHDFYIGKARLAVRDIETDLKGTFD